MSANKLTRHQIREAALTLLYQAEITGLTDDESINQAKTDSVEAFGLAVNSAVMKLVSGVLENKQAIDETIKKYSSTRKIERIPKINLSIMRIALYEMDFTDTPDKVAVNEAIELSKEYAYQPDSKLISGLLGNYFKDKHNER